MTFKRHIMTTSAQKVALVTAIAGAAFISLAPVAFAQDAAATSDSIVVTGIRKSLQSALKQKRNSDSMVEVIIAEDIGKFPDKNVADSLSRATGVNVVTGSANAGGFGENEKISIRGTDPNLNLTLLEGHNMATGDWFVLDQTNGGRSFNYTMLPSEVVGTVEVIKSSSADLPEGGIGGTVNVHLRRPFDLRSGTFTFSAQGLYATLSEKWTPNISGSYSWKNDNRTVGLLVGAYYEEREFRRDGQEILGYTTESFTGNSNLMPSLIGSAYFMQKRERSGANFMLQLRPSEKFDLDVSGLFTKLKADNENHNFMMWGTQLASKTPTAYTASGGYITSGSWAASPSTNAIVQDDIFRKAHSSSWNLNVDGTYRLSEAVTIKGQIGVAKGEGETDDTAAWETYWSNVGASYKLGNPVTQVTYTGLGAPTSAAYLNNFYSWSWGGNIASPDEENYAKVDVDWVLDHGALKAIDFGARYTDHLRKVDYTAYSWPGNGVNSGTSLVDLGTVFKGGVTPSNYAKELGSGIPGYSYADADAVYAYLDANNGGRTFGFYPPASFSVKEKTDAYYAMAKLGGDSWRGNVGLRAVHTNEESTQYASTTATDPAKFTTIFGNFRTLKTENDYWDWLPSANFTFKPQDDVNVRFSIAKVMTRPGYAQLAGAYYVVDSNLTGGSGGNPNLEPYRATQTNFGVEYYFAPEALFSAGMFYLDIQNYIEQQSFKLFTTTQLNPQGATFDMTGPANGGKATTKGFELSLQQPIGAGFGYIANFTYADAKNRAGEAVDGASKTTYNLTGYYEDAVWSARLAYNFRSKFKSGTDRGTAMWQDDYGTLDSSVSYKINENVSLTFDAQNLLHENLYYFVGNPSIPRAYYDNGHSYYVGARFKY